ncbi:MAG: DUF4845 domain-containing protein [Pseudomonadales bacterium]|nr:DUF4845 domain-containing protein [Pseudomonadales bacterium]
MKMPTLNSLHRQRGISKSGLLLLAVMITLFFTVGLKLGPLYVDHNLITGVCQELIDNGEADNMTISDVRDRVSATLRINSVNDFDLSDISMRKENGAAIITIAYERRVELVANLDMVATFDTVLQ